MQKYTGFLGIVFQSLITYVTAFWETVPNHTLEIPTSVFTALYFFGA